MSNTNDDNFDTDTDTDDQVDAPTSNGPDIKSLREAARAGKQALAENERVKRENLFLRAGIDPDASTPARKLFEHGSFTTIEELKAEAIEWGITGALGQVTGHPDATQEEFRAGLAGGASASTPPERPHPVTAAYEAFHKEVLNGSPRDDAGVRAVGRVIAAAQGPNGDKRLIFDPNEFKANAVRALPQQ